MWDTLAIMYFEAYKGIKQKFKWGVFRGARKSNENSQCSLTTTTTGPLFSLKWNIRAVFLTLHHYRQEIKWKEDALNSSCVQRIVSVRYPKVTTRHLYQTGSKLWSPGISPNSWIGYRSLLKGQLWGREQPVQDNKMSRTSEIAWGQQSDPRSHCIFLNDWKCLVVNTWKALAMLLWHVS